MKVKTTHYIIALLLLIVGQAGAQTKLEGRVLDSQTDEPIIGAPSPLWTSIRES